MDSVAAAWNCHSFPLQS